MSHGQQYFLVSAVCQSIIKDYFYNTCNLKKEEDINKISDMTKDERVKLLEKFIANFLYF